MVIQKPQPQQSYGELFGFLPTGPVVVVGLGLVAFAVLWVKLGKKKG